MKKVRVLDCTLRDGGYINNWQFGENSIVGILRGLEKAKIDIIECGFLRDVEESKDCSAFASMEQLANTIAPKNPDILYALMIEQHNHVDSKIPVNNGAGADIIRVTFRKKEWEETKEVVKELIEKGYKVCVQPVGTSSYTDDELMNLLNDVNGLHPYAFYLVDTLGVMYRHDIRRFFYLIDNNLSQNICLGFHSHNNLQLSFANAQEVIRLAHKRNLIIDSSCYGMGRGVGNLATELFADYINNNIEKRYYLTPILNIVDKYLMPIYAKQRWGYDLPYFLSATAKCHPNYAAHLLKKETLDMENIEKIISLIPKPYRSEYNSEIIEQLYLNYQNCEVDDAESFENLKEIINKRDVIVIGSGSSAIREKDKIKRLVSEKNLFSISVNYYSGDTDTMFISNEKRLAQFSDESIISDTILCTSNLKDKINKDALVFNYSSLLGEGDGSDNAGAMLIRILKNINVRKVYLAGFDGFDVDSSLDYFDSRNEKPIDFDTAKKKNDDIARQLKLALNGIEFELVTKTKYEI